MIEKDEFGIFHVRSRADLLDLARELGVRPDWHEPDNEDVEAIVFGDTFDNAGFWGRRFRLEKKQGFLSADEEMNVLLVKNGEPVAEVNLATLFSWACGFDTLSGGE